MMLFYKKEINYKVIKKHQTDIKMKNSNGKVRITSDKRLDVL